MKTKIWATRIPLNTSGELMCTWGISNSCSTYSTCHVTLVTNPEIRHQWRNNHYFCISDKQSLMMILRRSIRNKDIFCDDAYLNVRFHFVSSRSQMVKYYSGRCRSDDKFQIWSLIHSYPKEGDKKESTRSLYMYIKVSDVQSENLQYDHSLEGLTTETDNKLDSNIFQWNRNC